MNKYTLIIMMGLVFYSSISLAQSVGSAFNYQGELTDNGSPANGDYDITVKIFKTLTGGSSSAEQDFPDTPVDNGLFNLEVDFGDMVYENMAQYYIEIEVTPSTGGVTSTLAPRSKLLAVPHAVQAQFLAPGGASNGDILQYSNGNWGPANADNLSAWDVNGSILSTSGRVGIGTSNPTDRLHVNTLVGQDALRIQVDNATKLRVLSNGGTSLGANNTSTTPDNGLYVSGDVKQSQNSQGMIKFMLRVNCDSTPTITRQYNGTSVVGTATITRNADLTCDIDMPIDVGNYFISVTPRYINPNSERFANCQPDTGINTTMTCKMFSGAGNTTSGSFDVLLY